MAGRNGDVKLDMASGANYDRHEEDLMAIRQLAEVRPAGGACHGDYCGKCMAYVVAGFLWFFSILVSLIPITWIFQFKTLNDYERAVVFRLGKYVGEKGAGFYYMWPFIDDYRVLDMRIKTMDLQKQEMLTKESVTVHVNAVVLYYIEKATMNLMTIRRFRFATEQLAATAIRSVIGCSELDELLSHREKINERLKSYLDKETDSWGLKVTRVEIKDVTLPKVMQRSMGAQAESERERRAKVIGAEGEVQAAPLLLKAAQTLSKNSASLQLRFLDTLREISAEKNSTVVFPLPLEFMNVFEKREGLFFPENGDEEKIPMLEGKKVQ
ncbi:hypothetical protein AAMO2058_001048000 [Amorphochlora amoebiformis]|uniref:Band 7 domain-containing protein n=1 Tax=Amorphochlora amoebiformis TaxID=1561963 RepID=A0A7S0GNV3_9EUKA|mmetsp:Transcript_10543/g.16678  ORF Transcript_10543/g.16678 Transcript_10543/m.16678 type:complete len:326 (+) Transcript_10543:44-1021(+)